MVNLEYISAVKALLDADSALSTLLDVTEGVSKVLEGPEVDEVSYPVLNVAEFSNNRLGIGDFTAVGFAIMIRALNKEYNRMDITTIDSIADRIDALLDKQVVTLTSNQCKRIYADGALPPMPDPDKENVTLRQLRYRMLAV